MKTGPPIRSPMRLPALAALVLLAACADEPDTETTVPSTDPVETAAPAPIASGEQAEACTTVPASESDTLTVVFFGDSLTAGYGLANPDAQAYPALVEAKAREAGIPIRAVNAGNSGETTAGGLRRIRWILGDTRPDVFVLALGGNDGLRGLDPAAMEANLSAIFDCVREAAPEAALVLAGMEAPPNMGAAYTARFRAVFPAVAAAFGAARVPFLLEGVGGVARLNQGDLVHPTAEGQRRMAVTVWEALAPVLREATDERS